MTTASKRGKARVGAAASGAFQAQDPRGGPKTTVVERLGSSASVKAIPSLVERALQTAHEDHRGVRVIIVVEPGSVRGAIDIEQIISNEPTSADVDVEKALLGLLLFDNGSLDLIMGQVASTDFREPLHRRLFTAIEAATRRGILVEPTSLAEQFGSDSDLKEVGGILYLADLVNRAPKTSTASIHAKTIRDVASRMHDIRRTTDEDDLQVALGEARARGAGRAAEILAGPAMLGADDFAALIGVTREAVRQKMMRREVLGLQGAKRGVRYPAWQVREDGDLLPELPQLFRILGDSSWAVYRFLTQPTSAFKGAAPLEFLRAGAAARVLQAAEGVARGDFG
jgi:hypothetical protein